MSARVVLDVPGTTPKGRETGLLPMSIRVMKRKLHLINFIKNTDESYLSNQVFKEQRKNNWPGPIKEALEICSLLNLPRVANEPVARS